MRVVAILAVRNERPYLGNCLGHLIRNGIDYWSPMRTSPSMSTLKPTVQLALVQLPERKQH